jgi:hypothetical protein
LSALVPRLTPGFSEFLSLMPWPRSRETKVLLASTSLFIRLDKPAAIKTTLLRLV